MIVCQIEFIVTRRSSRLWDAAIKDLTKLRRQRQLQKTIGLVSKTTTLHVHHDYDVKWQHFKFFFEDGNGKAINSTICVWTWARPPLFSSDINSLLLSNYATWDNRDNGWKGCRVYLIFQRSFHGRRRCRIELYCRAVLAGKFWPSFLRNLGIFIKVTISSPKQCHSTTRNNTMTDKEQKETSFSWPSFEWVLV